MTDIDGREKHAEKAAYCDKERFLILSISVIYFSFYPA